MPQSLIVNLVTQSVVPQQHRQGYSLQQLFFHLVDIVDPVLGRVLRRDKRNRAYSLSALQCEQQPSSHHTPLAERNVHWLIPKSPTHPNAPTHTARDLQYNHNASIPAQTPCWWRISFLDDALFDHLISRWNQLEHEVLPIGSGSAKIIHVTTKSPKLRWASSHSYRDLYEEASAHQRDIHLQFVTPTAFATQDQITSLPTANAVFHALRKCWNQYSGLVFTPGMVDSVVPTHFNIQTKAVQISRRNSLQTMVGCTGQMSFRMLGESDPLIIKRINSLADFTRYCPIGCNTQLGMGIIHRLSSLPIALHNPQTN